MCGSQGHSYRTFMRKNVRELQEQSFCEATLNVQNYSSAER